MSFQDFYNQEFIEWSKRNYEALVNRHDDRRVMKIITRRYGRFKWMMDDVSLEDYTRNVFGKISEHNPEVLMTYMKDPKKENIAEKSQVKYMSNNIPGIIINRLSTKSKSVDNDGNIIDGCNSKCKSIDFEIHGHNNYFGFLKYTEESGGAQDNQFMDAQNFLAHALENTDECYFIIILDGGYYQKKAKNGVFKGTTRLNYLKSLVSNNKKIIIGTTDEVVDIVNQLENAGQ